jgi:bifunctional non-homologous end joining protein LigD
VATPVGWPELRAQLRPGRFSVITLPRRLASLKKDPWQDILALRQELPAAFRASAGA